jgi:Kef-type K+ transport system membrane component KefB
MPDSLQEPLVHLPILVRFAIVLGIFLLVPPLCRRIRIPPAVGLLLAGVGLGPSGLHYLPNATPAAQFFAEIGKLLLMFFVGLDIDLTQFRRTAARSLTFGCLTFSIPMVVGAVVALLSGYGWLAAALIGSLMASHTLLGFPIVRRMKLVNDEAVAVAIGGTVFTDFASLLVLAVCLPIHKSGFSGSVFAIQVVEMLAFVLVTFVGLSMLGRWLLERIGGTKERQVLLTLLIVALAGFGADAVGLDPIIGAFVAGLAVNRALSGTEAKEEVDFLGHTLFLPMFFVSIGFLIDVQVFLQTLVEKVGLVVGIVGGLIGAKYVAANLTRRVFRYSRNDEHLIWALSLPQVAATLAAAIVAFQAKNAAGVRLIDEPVLNTVLVLVVVTSVLGPILTEYFGRQRLAQRAAAGTAAVNLPETANQEKKAGSEAHSPGLIKVIVSQTEHVATDDRGKGQEVGI